MPARSSVPSGSLALALFGTIALVFAAAGDDHELFEDGFELATTCGWDTATDGNDDPAGAVLLTDSPDDCVGGGVIGGDLHPGDTDYLMYQFADAPACAAEPTMSLTSTESVSFCLYVECDEGSTEIVCPDGSVEEMLGDAPGCCRPAGTNIEITLDDFNCAGAFNESATVWSRLESASSLCTPYSITYDE